VIGGDHAVETSYHRTVSFGIRRWEFDDYLLQRSGARLLLGTPVSTIRRDDGRWILNDRISASTRLHEIGRWQREFDIALGAVRDAAALAREIRGQSSGQLLAKADRSPVTVADFAVQALSADRLARPLPDDALGPVQSPRAPVVRGGAH
jgi:hypothetical protein